MFGVFFLAVFGVLNILSREINVASGEDRLKLAHPPPQEHLTGIDLAWDNLSAVTFGYTLMHPRLHLVSNCEYRTMGTLFAELEKRYYRESA